MSKYSIPPSVLLSAVDLQARYRIGNTTLWRWRRDPEIGFPPAVFIGRRRYWRLAELEEWEASRPRRQA